MCKGYKLVCRLVLVLMILVMHPIFARAEVIEFVELLPSDNKPDNNVEKEEMPKEETVKEKTPKISATNLQLAIKKSKQLSIKNYNGKVEWESSDESVVRVSSKGLVKAVDTGDAVIYATAGERMLSCKVTVVQQSQYVKKWRTQNGRYYYYDKYGVMVKGIETIGGKTYCFDEKGRQRVGWLNVDDNYYFFNVGAKTKGYMRKNTTINGMRLNKQGVASVSSKNKKKLDMFVYASDAVFEQTKSTMSRDQALYTMFKKLAKNEIITYKLIGGFRNIKNWNEYYANQYFSEGCGDCYTYGSAFAYFAIALGYKDVYVESAGHHGWCKIGGKYYDPRFANWGTKNIRDGYAVPKRLSGVKGRYNWAKYAKYRSKVG